jgi:gluconokinase
MQQGIALTDDDRADWLRRWAGAWAHARRRVLTCSALKRAYRDTLRAAAPGLPSCIWPSRRKNPCAAWPSRPGHFYPPSLVASQFEALQDPAGEPGVLSLDAYAEPLDALAAAGWRSG